MKINFVIGEAQPRSGYIELNQTSLRDLNSFLDDGECTEILCLDTIDYFPQEKRGDFLNHLMQKLEVGSIMKVGGRELSAVANAVQSGQINTEQANQLLFAGGRQSISTCVETRNLLAFMNLEIVKAYYNNFNYIVEVRRVV